MRTITTVQLLSAAALATLAILPAGAQQQMAAPVTTSDPAAVTAGSYAIDGGHSQVLFSYRHMGLTQNMGILSASKGSLTIDPKNPSAATLSVTVPVTSLRTAVPALDEHLMKADFFDAAKYPDATFVSKAVKVDGSSAEVTGDLTIHGVTKPATFSVEFDAAGVNAMNRKESVSFKATTLIKRSDFGMGMAVPLVGDEVGLTITAAFEKQ